MRLRAILILALLVCSGACKEKYDARRDVALKDNLATMRNAIANYRQDHGRYPAKLEDLVPNYLRRIPNDPITEATTTWRLTTEETVQPSSDFQTGAPAPATSVIIDVHSGAPGADPSGVLYSNY